MLLKKTQTAVTRIYFLLFVQLIGESVLLERSDLIYLM